MHEHLARRARIVASRLGLDEERLIRWRFAHGVLSAVWSIEQPVFDPIGGIEAAQAALAVLGQRVGGGGASTNLHGRPGADRL